MDVVSEVSSDVRSEVLPDSDGATLVRIDDWTKPLLTEIRTVILLSHLFIL